MNNIFEIIDFFFAITQTLIYLRRAIIYVIVEIFDIRDVKSQYRRHQGYCTKYNSADLWLFIQE